MNTPAPEVRERLLELLSELGYQHKDWQHEFPGVAARISVTVRNSLTDLQGKTEAFQFPVLIFVNWHQDVWPMIDATWETVVDGLSIQTMLAVVNNVNLGFDGETLGVWATWHPDSRTVKVRYVDRTAPLLNSADELARFLHRVGSGAMGMELALRQARGQAE